MPCDTSRLPGQTLTERKQEIRATVDKLAKALAAGKIKPTIGPQGAVAFVGWEDRDRNRITDSCALARTLLTSGSALALNAIQKAEMLAGRKVDRHQVAIGAHSHDGGKNWHSHKG